MSTAVVTKSKVNHLKYLGVIAINLALAIASVYLFQFWFDEIMLLDAYHVGINISIVVLTAITYFIGQTYYTKGTTNVLKKILTLVFLSAGILGLMLLAVTTPADIIYPLSGVLITSVAYYMLSLSASTLGSLGAVSMGIAFGSSILFAWWFKAIEANEIGFYAKIAVFVMLFLGGVVPHIRAYAHGIRGVNRDGGGFGSNDSAGDIGDGDGDTGEE